jgi:hypothetical protein
MGYGASNESKTKHLVLNSSMFVATRQCSIARLGVCTVGCKQDFAVAEQDVRD